MWCRRINAIIVFSALAVILERPIRIPRSLSVKAASILKGFLNKNPVDRLGCHPETGFTDIINHPFFKAILWDMVSVIFYSLFFLLHPVHDFFFIYITKCW